MKSFKTLLMLCAIVAIATSCAKEELIQDPAQAYPQQMTIDNWEQFVDAPDEVLEKFHQAEMAKVRRTEAEPRSFDANRLVIGSFLLGELQVQGSGFNPATTYLGGTLVQMVGTSSTGNSFSDPAPFFSGQNWFISNLLPANLCFYHQGITSGSYPQTEWVNGVSTFDLVVIQRHILGITPFTELWQYLAADVDGSGVVDGTDINIIRDLILAIRTDLPPMLTGTYNQPVIYFPQGDYAALQANLAANLPFITSFYPVLTCQANNTDSDRFAIKRGDLNGNWVF